MTTNTVAGESRRVWRPPGGLAILLALTTVAGASLTAQRSRLTGGTRLTRVYSTILDARFDEALAMLPATCAPAAVRETPDDVPPAEACLLLEAVALWWRIELDPESRARDDRFLRQASRAVEAMEAWTRRQPNNPEAWFYLGGAYGVRAQWRVLRNERLAAARDGARIKTALERALDINPSLGDAYFGIGLYRYLADVVSGPERLLRWLLLLPGGNRTQGLRDMLRAKAEGQLLADEADYQLHRIYLWYEDQPASALALLRGLRDRHARNPLFWQLIAEVEDVYVQDATASLRAWSALLDAARGGRVSEPMLAEVRARLGIARQLDILFETDAALPHLQAVIDARPAAPVGAVAAAHLALGQALDRVGRRAEALVAYEAARRAAPSPDPGKISDRARTGLRTAPDATDAAAYRLSLEGWRALQRHDVPAAARALSQSLALRPRDLVTKYRQGMLMLEQHRDTDALALFEDVGGTNPSPPTVQAESLVEAARLRERMGDRARAAELYRFARAVFGADQRTIERAERARARLGDARTTP